MSSVSPTRAERPVQNATDIPGTQSLTASTGSDSIAYRDWPTWRYLLFITSSAL